jgi:hemerythrin superfamily protein
MAERLDVTELLVQDHRLIDRLLEQLDIEEDPAKLTDLLARIGGELSSHEAAEQQVVFPALRAALPTAEQEALQRLGEHEEVNELIAEMRALTASTAGFGKRACALILDLRAHFAAEEESLFPRLRAVLGPEGLAELAGPVLSAERSAPAFPQPDRPDHVHLGRPVARP